MRRRVDIKAILANPAQRRQLMVTTLIATQAREGVVTTQEQAEAAYDKVQEGLRACQRPGSTPARRRRAQPS